ncbi:MAG: NADP-dependent oxidoreductase [Pseudomonadota bacterium]
MSANPGSENRRLLLHRRPEGIPTAADFAHVSDAVPTPAEGEIVIRNHYASLDPAMRGWMDAAPSYMPPIALGDAVRATVIGRIAASGHPDFPEGRWAMTLGALEDYSVAAAGGFTQLIDADAVPSVTNYLSVFGAVGLTAYFGLLRIGRPTPGDTVLVTGAAGAVGSLVGQIAKIKGCRTVGIAGGPEKCARLTERYGYDAAIDYRDKDVSALDAAIRDAAPDGVDVIFENVGGDIFDAGLLNLNEGARVALCGLISEYNREPVGARNLWQLIVKSARIEGFLIRDFLDEFASGAVEMGSWLADGRLAFDEHVELGLDQAVPAFLKLFSGANNGKMILQIANDDGSAA